MNPQKNVTEEDIAMLIRNKDISDFKVEHSESEEERKVLTKTRHLLDEEELGETDSATEFGMDYQNEMQNQ